ncbi:DNA repair protein RadA/Sms [Jatrophihabitans endophyticus]|uniref:DNA repair protein RadA n=1 Tax=Jatrophihabitans endophyticus TaxID=1206085 RepID=A0A1M5R9S4_9ACTN|nr:DNA repair protein RadA [Jatrophihabitans endophyticus]SHH22563.1 DNA repair protein RadA/Sms [Jatrophihabitans endophyticus]
MPRPTTSYRCTACGATAGKWYGRCPKCGEFSTMAESVSAPKLSGLRASAQGSAPARAARPVSEVAAGEPARRFRTGVGEFDRVIGGGLVAGQVCLCSGAPGSGKSTLLLAVADSVARTSGRPVLYVSGEESVEQIAVRARRIGAATPQLLLADDTDLGAVLGHIEAHPDAALVVVDSVQTVASADVDGRAGGVTQVMEVAQVLTRVAKSRDLPMILVGQVTKDSTVAGPRALEHIVDTTLTLEGDRHTSLRLLRTVKNRFGSLEVAAFEQTDGGMQEVVDPSSLFREQRDAPVPGTCVTVTVEGHRALLAEVQALVAHTQNPNPRRGVSGLDSGRSAMLIAISERAGRLRLFDQDVFLATVAGMRLSDPATDLAVCLAILSAASRKAMPLDMLAIGEVTLSGDVRPSPMTSERVAEALRLGYRRLLVPVGTRSRLGSSVPASRLVEVGSLVEAELALRAAPEPTGTTSTPMVTLRPVPALDGDPVASPRRDARGEPRLS